MSYSFNVRGETKAELMEKVIAELDKVVDTQPIHSADRLQAQTAVQAFVEIVQGKTDNLDYYVSVSGSLSWNGLAGTPEQELTSASVNIHASLISKV